MARSIGTSLIDVAKTFATEEACLAYLEAARWPEGVRCLKCGSEKISKFTTKETSRKRVSRKTGEVKTVVVPARHLYQCLNSECNHQFTATTGTIFHDTHLPLQKWFFAIALVCNAKKGVSAKQLERDLDVNYRTAWYLSHRIREAMTQGNLTGLLTGTVEVDETYVGGKYHKRLKRERWDKEPVVGILQRGTEDQHSRVMARHVSRVNAWSVGNQIRENVSRDAAIMTDESKVYARLGSTFAHEIVNHRNEEWVRGDIHTNGIENFWSLFKRGVIGTFHKVSIKHLDRYLAEFCYRFNNRRNEALFAETVTYLAIAAALPYARLIGRTSTDGASEA